MQLGVKVTVEAHVFVTPATQTDNADIDAVICANRKLRCCDRRGRYFDELPSGWTLIDVGNSSIRSIYSASIMVAC